jgi:hypothetical protein
MNSVFLLWYIVAPDTDDEDELLIGAYSSEAEAQAAIERLKAKPGFVNSPAGFQIHPRTLNVDSWTDGFIFSED